MLFSDIEQDYREYLWLGRILKADVTYWLGAAKAGKGLLWAQVVACVVRGWPMPPFDPDDPTIDWDAIDGPQQVITIALEDDAGMDLKNRFKAAGVRDCDEHLIDDMSHVERASATGGSVSSRFVINSDLGLLSDRIDELGNVGLVVIDPLMAAAGSTVSYNQQVRHNIIEPLQELARTKGVAILLVGHFTKGLKSATKLAPTSSITDKAGGSQGLIDAFRLTCGVMQDTADPTLRRLVVLASNGGMPDDVIEFMIEADGIADPDAHLVFRQPPPAVGDEAARQRLQAAILRKLIESSKPMTDQEMVALTRLSYQLVKKAMRQLHQQGLIEKRRGRWSPAAAIEAPVPAGRLTL